MGVSALLSAAPFVSAQDHPSSAPPDSPPFKVQKDLEAARITLLKAA
jgi:hypothetical protein